MQPESFPVIQVSGSPYERGHQHGSLARERVARSIEIYREAFAESASLDWPEVLDQAANFAGLIRDFDANIFTEMNGIA
ncbi:MAG TPA: hypothetical protein VHV31_11355, partial [Nitrolancea sp.]|nr:hypothetical protein [Nitrolancea sp.]